SPEMVTASPVPPPQAYPKSPPCNPNARPAAMPEAQPPGPQPSPAAGQSLELAASRAEPRPSPTTRAFRRPSDVLSRDLEHHQRPQGDPQVPAAAGVRRPRPRQEPRGVREALAAGQGRPRRLLGGTGPGAALVQAVGQGARLERAARALVRRRP